MSNGVHTLLVLWCLGLLRSTALQTADERSAAADQAVADRARKQLEHVDKAHHRRVLSDQEADELARAKEAAIAECA